MEFGKRVAKLLEDRNLKQKDFATAIGEDPVSVNRYIKGSRPPKVEFINKVIKYFPDVDLNWLFRGKVLFLDEVSEEKATYIPRTPDVIIEHIEENLKELKAKMSQK